MIKLNAERVSESLKRVYQEKKEEIISKRHRTMIEHYDNINPFQVTEHTTKNIKDTLYNLMSETGLSRTDYCCYIKNIIGLFVVDIFFPEKNKVIILNNSYTFLPKDIERNKIIESDLKDFEMECIYIVKEMLYKDREKFKEYVMGFYNDTLEIEDKTKLIIK